MQITITPYGLNALQQGLKKAPQMAQRELLAAMSLATAMLEADVVAHYPTHLGVTRASIVHDAYITPVGVLGVVGSPSPVAAFVELGTRPHTPPLAPLLAWVQGVLGVTGPDSAGIARAIQRKISRVGTAANPQFADALARNQFKVRAMFEAAAGRIAANLAGGGKGPEGAPA